jgi:hypothetical protein
VIARGAANRVAITLTPEQWDAVLAVLEDPPDGLEELRGVLARDQRHRAIWPLIAPCTAADNCSAGGSP